MRIEQDRLVFYGICALHELADRATAAPQRPDHLTKAVPAFLFSHSDGRRDPYDDFWRAISAPLSDGWSETQQRDYRRCTLHSALNSIARTLRVQLDIEYMHRIGEALHGPSKHPWRPQIEAFARAEQERREQRARRGDCGWL